MRGMTEMSAPTMLAIELVFAVVFLSWTGLRLFGLFSENRLSAGLLDDDLRQWFREEFAWLAAEPNVDVLWNNTDLGVG